MGMTSAQTFQENIQEWQMRWTMRMNEGWSGNFINGGLGNSLRRKYKDNIVKTQQNGKDHTEMKMRSNSTLAQEKENWDHQLRKVIN